MRSPSACLSALLSLLGEMPSLLRRVVDDRLVLVGRRCVRGGDCNAAAGSREQCCGTEMSLRFRFIATQGCSGL
jgi:hypothetical protein